MNELTDPLSGELSIEAKLEASGIKASAKSRSLVALDRLIGSAIDIPGAVVEGWSRRIRAHNQVKEKLILTEGSVVEQNLALEESAGQRLLDNFLHRESAKQINRDAVANRTIYQLQEDISESDEDFEGPLNEDWMNVFSVHAENASSDHLREMWGRILSGEIRKPGSFSIATLRFISELDKEIATVFQNRMKTRLQIGFLPKPTILAGEDLMDFTFLEEVGLLQDVNGFISHKISITQDGYGVYGERDFILRLKPAQFGGTVSVPLIKITRVGKEIAAILPEESPDVALRAAAEAMAGDCEAIDLGRVISRGPGNSGKVEIIEKIK